MIVDTDSDINVYKELVQGQEESGGTEYQSQASSCCGGVKGNKTYDGDLLDHDFNEWVGECRRFKCSGARLTSARILPSLCDQTLSGSICS